MLLEILCHDGTVYSEEVETFDFQAFDESMKDNNRLGVVIGSKWFSRIDIKRVIEFSPVV